VGSEHFRFASENRHRLGRSACPIGAKCGHHQHPYQPKAANNVRHVMKIRINEPAVQKVARMSWV
jgi:hypothetical protein